MAEKLTKTALKNELTRRIDWLEKSYGFSNDTLLEFDMRGCSHHKAIAFGRYRALIEMRYQISNGLFIGGYAC